VEKELIANKIKSSISLPLTKFGKVVGVFGFHSSVLNFFDDEEIALLEEAAGDVSFAMEVLEKTKIHKATEKLVVTNEKRFRALVENGADAVVILTAEGKPIYASPTVEKVLGYTEEEVMKLDIFSNIHPDDFAATANIMQQVMANPGIPIAGQTGRMMHKDGTWRWIAATVTNMLHDPAVNGIVDNFRDVTDKVNAEEQKEFDKNNTDALINNTNDLMWSVDRDYNLITANQPFEEMSKINFGRIVEKGESVITKAYTPEMTAHYKQQYDRAFTGEAYKETEHFTVPFEFWVEISYSPIRKGDEVIGTACQSRDITQIKKAEQQLQKSEAFSRGVLNSLSSHIAVVDATGNIVAVNEAWKRFALKNGETSLQRTGAGSNYFSVCEKSAAAGDETAVEVLQAMQDVLHKKKTVLYFEYPCHSPDKKRWFGMRIMKFDTDELMLVIAHLEITTRMLAEENLFKSEAQLNEAQSISQLGNWEISLPDNVVHWSNELYKIYGYTKEELQPSTETFMSLMHPDDKKSTEKKMEQDFEVFKASEMNFRFIRKDGVIRHGYAEWKFEFDKNNKPQRVFGIVQDVTEKKEAELKLIHSEQHNRALIENITDAILLTDENGNVIYQSASAERIGGFSSADMNGKNMFEFLHIDDAENWVTIFQQAYASPGVPMQNQFRILHKQGYYIWVEGTITNLLHDENVKAFIINYRDISERKQAQEKLDNTLLELEQRVEERTKDLSDKNKSITDSISYAKRIQIGLLTPHSELGRLFPKSFILSEPQHIVSGDFFWCYQKNNKKFVVVADCTGHGVPGALMSIIGNNLLNSIIVDEHIDNPSEILQMLDITLKVAVKGDRGEIKDGMDIALCVIDTYFKEVYFAGAYRPLFVSDENGLINELSGTSCSIGGGMGETGKNFETKRFPIIPGQRIYLTSDGYISQFGGPLGKKFMKKRFKIMLEEIQSLSIQEQKDSLINAFKDWSGGNEQVDDVMVVGIEL
jgi:PAS domain S-box-containing protein